MKSVALFIFCLAGFLGLISESSALNIYKEAEELRKSDQKLKIEMAIEKKRKLLATATPTFFDAAKGSTPSRTPTSTFTTTPTK